jgi:hypothetical protein
MTGDPKEPLESELPEDLARLLRQERSAPGPAAGVEARVLSRLEQTLGLPPPGGGGGDDGASGSGAGSAGGAAAGTAAGISKAAAILAASVAFGVGAGAGVLGHASFQGPPAAPSVEVRTVVSVVRVVETAPAPSGVAAPVPVSASASAAVPARPHAAPTPTPAVDAAARDRALAEENALIARAQSALARGNVAQARAALNEHASRFPNGQLGVERKLLEAHTTRLEHTTP